MKKLLATVVLGLLWCNIGISNAKECQTIHTSSLYEIFFETLDEVDCVEEAKVEAVNKEVVKGANKFNVQGLIINLSNQYELKKIGSSSGNWWGNNPYKFVFYAEIKEGKFISLLEIFNLDYGIYKSQTFFYDWVKKILFKKDPKSGCNESISKQYFQILNKGASGIHCVSVKILNNTEIYSPHFVLPRFNMSIRKAIVKKFIEKNNLEIPDQMLRSEHFFYTLEQLNWVFFTDLTSGNLNDEQIENFIIDAIDMHKGFENDLKLRSKYKIDFPEFQKATIK